MFMDFADLGNEQIIARGGATFAPDAQYGIPEQDMGEIDLSTSDETTYQERRSRKHRTRVLLSRTATEQTKTIDITFYDRTALTQFMKNLGKPTTDVQAPGVDGVFPAEGAPAYYVTIKGQVVSLGKRGVYAVAVLAGQTVLEENVDYRVLAPAGRVEFLRPQGANLAITITFSYMGHTSTVTPVGTLPEVRGIVTVIGVSAEDTQEQELEQYYIGVAPNAAINRITGDDGEQGWAVQGRVYTNPYDAQNPYGRSESLPSLAAIQAFIDN